jgi:FMN reductase
VSHLAVIDGSPAGGGRTSAVLRAVDRACGLDDVPPPIVSLAAEPMESVVDIVEDADAVVLGSPIYRASFAFPLKVLLDNMPRGMWGETRSPLRGKAVCIVATGASLHHFLALDDLRNVLSGFFAAHVVPPGLYVPRDGFDDAGTLVQPYADYAQLQGQALAELTAALDSSTALRALGPHA